MTLMNLPSVSALAVFTLTAASFAADISIEQDLVYGHAEGIELKLDVARPAKGSGPFPTVICIHGGAWMSGNKSGYTPFLRMLAQNGYVAASVDGLRICQMEPTRLLATPQEDIIWIGVKK